MLIYPDDLRASFEFDKIAELLAGHCRTIIGAEHARDLPVLTDEKAIHQRLDEAAEFQSMQRSDASYPVEDIPDLRAEIAQLDQDEAVLDQQAVHRLRIMLRACGQIRRFFQRYNEDYPTLSLLSEGLTEPKALIRSIDLILDDHGNIRPNASPELVSIRKNLESRQREQIRAFRSALQRLRQSGALAETEESVRGGRQVLALKSEFKRRVSGIVHDESDTGKTTFLEPEETVHLNNAISELHREELREIRRILRDLTRSLSPHQDELADMLMRLGWLDFCRAKALLADEMEASRPPIKKGSRINLHHARHPLLLLMNRRQRKATVPMDLNLDSETRILVVSGPNAGGKSVCLKTTGLLQLMVQAGLLVPVDPSRSQFGIFHSIMGDIGDAQSLQDELSTYSSRLIRMRYFLEHAGADALFLIDEFGSGTDPGLGGAVAEAILDALRRSLALGVVTTHYANLKIYAGRTPGLENGAMVFDERKLEPLYRLECGKPGSSYTFEIARKISLPAPLIRHAESLIKQENLEFEGLLSKVQGLEQELDRRQEEIGRKERELNRQMEDYKAATLRLEEEKNQIKLSRSEKQLDALARYEAEFSELLQQLRQQQAREQLSKPAQAESIHQALRKNKASSEELRGQVKKLRKALKFEDAEGEIETGSAVRLASGQQSGRVLELRKNKALVSFGQLHSTVALEDLVLIKESSEAKGGPRRAPIRPQSPEGSFDRELDIRGKTRDEAIEAVDQYLNDAVMRSVLSVRIIHGKGTGVLRDAVKQTARRYSAVSQIRHEDPKLGGDGVSIIEFV